MGFTLAVLAIAAAQGGSDTTRTSREAFNTCLRQFTNQSILARTAADAFQTALGQQCGPQAASYRAALVQRERSSRASQADADRTATEELDAARENFKEIFLMSVPPS